MFSYLHSRMHLLLRISIYLYCLHYPLFLYSYILTVSCLLGKRHCSCVLTLPKVHLYIMTFIRYAG